MSNQASEYETAPDVIKIMTYRGRNFRYFNIAKKAALCSEQTDYKHGAVLVKGGSILNTSCNKNRLVSFGSRFCDHNGIATFHAELGAILGIDRSITEGASIYVCRIGKSHDFRLSKPCSMCAAAMSYVGIKRVYWTIDERNCAMGKL